MSSFDGFSDRRTVQLPLSLFTQALPEIDDLHELKVVLLALWLEDSSEDQIFYLRPAQLAKEYFSGEESEFQRGFKLAVEHGYLLAPVRISLDGQPVEICFLNTPRGRAGLQAVQSGQFRPGGSHISEPQQERPNIFKLYEENIGALTPIIADTLRDLEETYSPEWIAAAVKTAVKNNARSLRYIEVVLQNWQEEGKHVGTDRRRSKKTAEEYDPEGYTDGEFSDFIDY